MADFDKLLDRIVEASRKAERTSTVTEAEIGRTVHRAIIARVGRTDDRKIRRTLRAEALLLISERLKAEGCLRCNLNRAVQVYSVGQCFDEAEAKGLPIRTVRMFARLIRRDTATEKWSLREKTADQAKQLWSAVVVGETPPADVRQAVDNMLGVKPRPPRSEKPKPSPAAIWARFVTTAEPNELGNALTAIAKANPGKFEQLARVMMAVQKRREEPAPPVVESPRKGLLGRRREAA